MEQINGIIRKGIGGFYYVEAAGAIYECKAKGIFRKDGVKPVAGDRVMITCTDSTSGVIEEIKDRRNYLERPPVANIDLLAITVSATEPAPNTLITDKLIAMAEKRDIEPVILLTKADLAAIDVLYASYKLAGFQVFAFSGEEGDYDALKATMDGKITAFCGNSGVGKSTLINRLSPGLHLPTAQISMKLGRGKHTTRHTELFKLGSGYIIDTAGFSDINMLSGEAFLCEDLPFYFRDFVPYLTKCRFSSCTHVADSGCAICEAVKNGEISALRHESYVAMYQQIKDLKKWQI